MLRDHVRTLKSFKNFKLLFILLFLFGWVFIAAFSLRAFSSCSKWRLLSSWGAWASHCSGFSCWGTGFSGRSTWAQLWCMGLQRMLLLPWNMWNLPGPGIKPVSPSLAGRFLSTVPPGKSKEKNSLHCSCNFPVSFRSLKNNSKIISKSRELLGKVVPSLCYSSSQMMQMLLVWVPEWRGGRASLYVRWIWSVDDKSKLWALGNWYHHNLTYLDQLGGSAQISAILGSPSPLKERLRKWMERLNLTVQRLGICLPIQGAWVRPQSRETPHALVDSLTIGTWAYFWVFYPVLLIYVSIFVPVHAVLMTVAL